MGCFSSLRLWRRKKPKHGIFAVTTDSEKSAPPSHASVIDNEDLEKPRGRSTSRAPSTPGGWERPDVSPAYSAYSTPGSPTWTARARGAGPTHAPSSIREAESIGDEVSEEQARRRKAQQEEQERLDFFQML